MVEGFTMLFFNMTALVYGGGLVLLYLGAPSRGKQVANA